MDTLLNQALEKMADDMKAREIGAVIWSIPDADFHFIPEIVVVDPRTNTNRTARITGLYLYQDKLYAMEEDLVHIDMENFYRPGVDVPPVVVTLSESKAREELGVPTAASGYTTQGTLEEWVAIADCYFEALAED